MFQYIHKCFKKLHRFSRLYIFQEMKAKVAFRVEKTEVFKKGWNIAGCSRFASCIMKKHFLSWRRETTFFSYFHYEIIFCCAEVFECAFNFRFCENSFIFLNMNINQISKDQDLNFTRSSYFVSSRKEVHWK